MREILFRGKTEKGKWKYSMSLARHATENGIITSYYIGSGNDIVKAETVGQYTGLTDKNGKKIFEGDILSVTVREIVKECGVRKFTGRTIKTVWSVEYAEWRSQGNGFYVFGKDRRFSLGLTKSVIYNASPEIIGNIHDNPELVKGGEG